MQGEAEKKPYKDPRTSLAIYVESDGPTPLNGRVR